MGIETLNSIQMKAVSPPLPIVFWPETLLAGLTSWVLAQNALTGHLSYAFCAVLSPVLAGTFTIGGAYRVRILLSSRPFTARDALRSLSAASIALGLALLILLAHSVRYRTCSYGVGLLWFLLLPATSTFFGLATGAFAARLSSRRRTMWIIAFTPAVIFAILNVVDLLSTPALFVLHPWGYAAGPIYEDFIPLSERLISYRLYILGVAAVLLISAVNRTKRKFRWKRPIALAILGFFAGRAFLSWAPSHNDLKRALGGEIQTAKIHLIYEARGISAERAKFMAEVLTYRTKEIASGLQLPASKARPIRAYVFSNPDTQQFFTGTRFTAIGNPVQTTLFLPDGDPLSRFWVHELTHVMAAPYGVPGLGLALKPAVLEGLATAMEKYRGDLSIHEWARALQMKSQLPNIPDLFGTASFFRAAPEHAYLASGSFITWLLNTYGVSKVARMYRGVSPDEIFHRSLSELQFDWERELSKIRLSPQAQKLAEHRLKARSIFHRPCPYDVAREEVAADRCTAEARLRDARAHDDAALDFSGAQPRLALLTGDRRRLGGETEKARELFEKVLRDIRASDREKLVAARLLGDTWVSEDIEKATRYYEMPDPLLEDLALSARRELLNQNEIEKLRELISGQVTLQNPEDITRLPITATLLARNAAHVNKWSEVLRLLEKRDKGALTFENERLRVLARAYEGLGQMKMAEEIVRRLFKVATTDGEKLHAQDEIHRLRQISSIQY